MTDTTAIKALIAENRWQPIEEMSSDDKKRQMLVRLPRNNGKFGIAMAIYIGKREVRCEDWGYEDEESSDYDEENDTHYVPEAWYECIESDASDYGYFAFGKRQAPTHFMHIPCDTSPLADVAQVLLDALLWEKKFWDEVMMVCPEQINIALKLANEIAGKK